MDRLNSMFFNVKTAIFFALLLVLTGGCGQVEDQITTFETIAQGLSSSITSERFMAIRDQTSWESFWRSHSTTNLEVPAFNFFSDIVIVVHLGMRPLDPRMQVGVEITNIENSQGKLIVYYDEVVPSAGCITRELVSKQPYHIIKTVRNDEKPEFVKSERKHSCI